MSQPKKTVLSLIILDINFLKKLNDNDGHNEVDQTQYTRNNKIHIAILYTLKHPFARHHFPLLVFT